VYDRYLFGSQLSGQPREVYEIAARLRGLWSLPHREFRPEFETYAFSNPTLRIVDVSGIDGDSAVEPR
jgi:hypothetical protein